MPRRARSGSGAPAPGRPRWRPRSPHPASPGFGQRATISRSGSSARWGSGRPQRLGHERHHRVEQAQVRVEHLDERPPCGLALAGAASLVGEPDLGHSRSQSQNSFQIASYRTASPRRSCSPPWRHRPPRPWPRRATGSSARPAQVRPASGGGGRAVGRSPPGRAPEHEARRVPELVGEVARVLELGGAEPLVVARASAVESAKRSASAPVSSIDLERVDDVAFRLGHLLAVRVAHEAVQVDRVGRAPRPVSSRPSIIIRATQKKRMS